MTWLVSQKAKSAADGGCGTNDTIVLSCNLVSLPGQSNEGVTSADIPLEEPKIALNGVG